MSQKEVLNEIKKAIAKEVKGTEKDIEKRILNRFKAKMGITVEPWKKSS